MRRTSVLGLLLGLSLLVGACAGAKQPNAADLQKKVSTQLRDVDASLTKKQADCYAKLIVSKVGTKTANKITVTEKDPESKVKKALASAAIAATQSCGVPTSTTAAP
jgi:hypothetical protein